MSADGARVFQLKCTLKGVRPPIWRRLLVRSDMSLRMLHYALQYAMGWTDTHLHEFVARGVACGLVEEDWQDDLESDRDKLLAEVVSAARDQLLYRYDFGDEWECDIVLEKVLQADSSIQYPVCTGGKRAGPPDDVGGVNQYPIFLDALADPAHPEHQMYREWIGEDFDSEAFDPADVNQLLREFPVELAVVQSVD